MITRRRPPWWVLAYALVLALIGMHHLATDHRQDVRAMTHAGSTAAFTAHSGTSAMPPVAEVAPRGEPESHHSPAAPADHLGLHLCLAILAALLVLLALGRRAPAAHSPATRTTERSTTPIVRRSVSPLFERLCVLRL
ncbi:hypothetical protein [Saccharothrix violaceirubra]|uniref:Uncharacterized protein n=1 Tax=Saccharothrix violaceirubra TaxID=413306 RepID=A0A7W7T5T1_9PSEU|nr:hypothetical protein [Saccharothrix violaceirubra]MBB4967075.1 hypothetical protein [Saccharothrix violaceirubra]